MSLYLLSALPSNNFWTRWQTFNLVWKLCY